MMRLVGIVLPVVMLLASCSLNPKAVVRNDSNDDITVVVRGQRFVVAGGAMSKRFDVPGWVLKPELEHIWEFSVISGDCTYRYPVPALKNSPSRFPQDPLIVSVQPDLTLKFEYPDSWKQLDMEFVQLAGKPQSDCSDSR